MLPTELDAIGCDIAQLRYAKPALHISMAVAISSQAARSESGRRAARTAHMATLPTKAARAAVPPNTASTSRMPERCAK